MKPDVARYPPDPSQRDGPPRRTRRPLRILVCWELGNGLGHVGRLRPLVERLAKAGHIVHVAARFPDNALSLLEVGAVSVEQAPFWTFERAKRGAPKRRPATTLAGILERGGFADPSIVAAHTEEWTTILRRTRPDIVVSEYAPGLNAVVRGRAPLLVIGSGFSVPPADGLYPLSPLRTALPVDAVASARRIASAFARVAPRTGFHAPRSFGDMFAGTASLPLVHPSLDPYRRWRKMPSLPPIGVPIPATARPAASNERSGLFIYLPERHPLLEPLLDALADLAWGGSIYVQPHGERLDESVRSCIGRTPLRLLTEPADLSRVLSSVRAVVHSGGANVAHAALYARTPQLLLPTVLEQRLTGEAIRAAGGGDFLPPRGTNASKIHQAIEKVAFLGTREGAPVRRDPGERTLMVLEHLIGRMTDDGSKRRT